jgi:hypothetical protein
LPYWLASDSRCTPLYDSHKRHNHDQKCDAGHCHGTSNFSQWSKSNNNQFLNIVIHWKSPAISAISTRNKKGTIANIALKTGSIKMMMKFISFPPLKHQKNNEKELRNHHDQQRPDKHLSNRDGQNDLCVLSRR